MAHSFHEIKSAEISGQKTLSSYLCGLGLCIVLTLAAFALVYFRMLSNAYLYVSLGCLALVQLFVQSVCFLRLNASSEGQWNLLPYLFTILIIAVLIGGSLWIMYNLNYNMVH